MRIAIDCTHYWVPGGIRAYIGNLLPALAATAPGDEWLQYVRGRHDPAGAPPLAGAAIVRERAPRRVIDRLQNWFGRPRAEHWCGAIDVFHGMHFHSPPTRRALRVLTLHDIAYLRAPELYADRAVNDYGYRWLLPRTLARLDRLIVSSQATRRDVVEHFGFPDEKTWVVHFGADPRFRRAAAGEVQELRARLKLTRPYIVYPAGTLDRRKNIANVLAGYAAAFPVRTERPLLVVTGVGAAPPEAAAAAAAHGVQDDWRVLRVDEVADRARLYSGAEWGVYLSLYEGFGVPVLEMLGCGVPLVASDRSSVPEVAGDAALLADPGDVESIRHAMREMHSNRELRAALAARALARAQLPYWTWRRAAEQVLAVYRGERGASRSP